MGVPIADKCSATGLSTPSSQRTNMRPPNMFTGMAASTARVTLEQLDTWADRILDAPTLEELFATH